MINEHADRELHRGREILQQPEGGEAQPAGRIREEHERHGGDDAGADDERVRKRIDEDRYTRKFTPRKLRSKWSDINRKRYAELAKAGRLRAAGKARSPKDGGRYGPLPTVPATIPASIAKALKASPKAWTFFKTLTPREQRHCFGWIGMAKQQETRDRRLREVVRVLSARQKLGLK